MSNTGSATRPTNVFSDTPKVLGQYWTPDWVARAMVAYGNKAAPGSMLDPAVGKGVFPLWAERLGLGLSFTGVEKDGSLVSKIDIPHIRDRVIVDDFLTHEFEHKFDFIVANPPYIRHHHLPAQYKTYLGRLSEKLLGFQLDKRAGLHVYFLIKALSLLKPQGRLSFILPSDVFEGIFAQPLWAWVAHHFKIGAVVTFEAAASPFPDLDINPVIVFLENSEPSDRLHWVRVMSPATESLYTFIASGATELGHDLRVLIRPTKAALSLGLTRPPRAKNHRLRLGDLALVKRGIATGDNNFFLFSKERLRTHALDRHEDFLLPVVARTRYLRKFIFTQQDLKELEAEGKPIYLLSPDSRPLEEFPEAIRIYLESGEQSGLTEKYTFRNRNPWYKMETRDVPELFFTYLGRRNPRFVRNLTNAVPLSTVFAVYPHEKDERFLQILLEILNNPATLQGLIYVAKSYGRNALKPEPNQLEKLAIPDELGTALL